MKQVGLSTLAALALVALLTSSGCPPPSSEKEIVSFSFTAAANPSLANDVAATIDATKITAIMPVGATRQALVATFETTGVSVSVGGTEQISGITSNDFTSPLTYTVTAEDASVQEYAVSVSSVAAN